MTLTVILSVYLCSINPNPNSNMAKKTITVASSAAEKLKALQSAMSKIEKDFGKGSIMKMGDQQIEHVEVVPSGSIGLDYALGVGGYPRGRIIEIYGPESSGKTTLAIHAIAEAQKAGGTAAFIDAEHAFDRFYAQDLGVDIDNLLISQPDNGEQALEIADQLIRSSAIDIIVIDSVAALTPKAEIEGDMGDNKDGDEVVGFNTKVKVVKNKVAPPFKQCEFEIAFGVGISRLGEVADLGVDLEIIKKSGSWYSYGATKLGQGREGLKRTLSDNPELMDEITAKIKEALQGDKALPLKSKADADDEDEVDNDNLDTDTDFDDED